MKAKLFRLIFVGIFLMSSMPLCAQTYICLQKDVDAVAVSSNRYLKLYKHSTLKVADVLKVRVDSMTVEAKNNQTNIDGGLVEGAVFDVTKDDTVLSKVHYKDNKTDRFGVRGVTISINYLTTVDGIEYLITKSDAKEINLTTAVTDVYKKVFQLKYYDETATLVYVPTATDQLPEGAKLVIDGAKQISTIKENEPIDVHIGANIRLILSSEGTYFLDELFRPWDLKLTYSNNHPTVDDIIREVIELIELNANTLYCIIVGVIALLLILFFRKSIILFFRKSKKEKDDNSNGEIEDEFDDNDRVVSKHSKKDKKSKQRSDNKSVRLSGDMTPDLKQIIQQFDKIQGSLDQMTPVLNQIRATISDGKEVERMNREIEQKNSTILQLDKIIKEKDTSIGLKKEEIIQHKNQINALTSDMEKLRHQLEEANKLDKGTLVIADGKILAQMANGLLAVCRKGEEIVKQYISTLHESDNLKMSYFLANYIKEMPSKSRDQWNGVMSTLSIKGFVNDLEITRYLQSESDQISWLKKHFIEDLLQSYISPLIIMLDQIRCSKQFGVTMPTPSNIEKTITEIIEECKKFGVTVKYKPLFELITTDDKERVIDEIGSDLPKAIEDVVSVKENVPLFFTHIGVVAEGVKDDKTICIAKL